MNPPLKDIAKSAIMLGYRYLRDEQAVVIVAPPDAKPLAQALETEVHAQFPQKVIHVTDNQERIFASKKNGAKAPYQNNEQEHVATCLASGGVCFRIYSPRPDLLKGISPQNIVELHATFAAENKTAGGAQIHPRWPIIDIPYPTESWALQVYPESTPDEALANLWQALSGIFALNSEKPLLNLSRQMHGIDALKYFLRRLRLCALSIRGREIELHLPLNPDRPWSGGETDTLDGGTFYSVLPFGGLSTPVVPGGAAGFVRVNRPLMLAGERVNGVDLTIENGVVTDIEAQNGAEALNALLNCSPRTRNVAALRLPVFMHHPGPTDQAFCNPNMDCTSSYGLTLSDPTVVGALGFDLFFYDDGLVMEGTDDQGKTHRLDDLLRSAAVFEERCREADFGLPSQGIDANALSESLDRGKALLAEGYTSEALFVLEETLWRTKESFFRDVNRQLTDYIFFWRCCLSDIIKETRLAIEEIEQSTL